MNITPFTKFKILSCYKEIKQILNGSMPIPRVIEIMPSNLCNHSCRGCHSKILHNKRPFFLDFNRLKGLIDEFSKMGIEGIEISGGGEPLLYPDIIDLIKYANKKKLKIGLITNGITLDKTSAKNIIKNLLFVRIAFDAGNRDSYKLIHGQDDYPQLIDNIAYLIKERSLNGNHIIIGLKFLVSKLNYNEIPQTAKIARDLKVDYLQFKMLRNSKYEIKKKYFREITNLIKDAQNFTKKNFEVIDATMRNTIKTKCYLTPLHPCIDTRGDVYLCYFFQHRRRSHRIGNINNNSFRGIWGSNRHKFAIRNINPTECNTYDCIFSNSINLINEALIKNKMHLEFV